MSGVNKVLLVGRLGGDPEIRHTANGNSVCQFKLATSESWKDKDGNRQDRTEWHRIVVWGKHAENCARYLSKGKMAFVEGRIQTRSYDDKEGSKRYLTEIVANDVQFLSSRNEGKPDGSHSEDDSPVPDVFAGPGQSDDIPF